MFRLQNRVAHFLPDPRFPVSPFSFRENFLRGNGEMGRDGDENHPQIEMGMGGGPPSPFPHFPKTYINIIIIYILNFIFYFLKTLAP